LETFPVFGARPKKKKKNQLQCIHLDSKPNAKFVKLYILHNDYH